MGRRRAEEKFLCVNELKNATSIIQQSINTTLSKDAILNSKFKSVPSIPCFLASFHVNVFINYVRLNCRIKFYLNADNAYLSLLG